MGSQRRRLGGHADDTTTTGGGSITGDSCGSKRGPVPLPSPSLAATAVSPHAVVVVMVVAVMDTRRRLPLASVDGRAWNVGDDLGDVPDGLGPTLPEHHASAGLEVFGVLDEAEVAGGLVARAEVLLVHVDDGGSLSGAATVHCRKTCHSIYILSLSGCVYARDTQHKHTHTITRKHICTKSTLTHTHTHTHSHSPMAWYLGLMVVGWCSTSISPSNSQQAVGSRLGSTITMPFLIWLRRICTQQQR